MRVVEGIMLKSSSNDQKLFIVVMMMITCMILLVICKGQTDYSDEEHCSFKSNLKLATKLTFVRSRQRHHH
jgi:hypothetical protein